MAVWPQIVGGKATDPVCSLATLVRNAHLQTVFWLGDSRFIFFKEGRKMLVLNRKRDEKVIIGNEVVVTVLDVRGDQVRLGFAGPVEVPIHREEVYHRIRNRRGETEHVRCP